MRPARSGRHPAYADGSPGRAGGGPQRGRAGPGVATTRIFVGAGRAAGIRPQDLVGAIAGESRLTGRDIGAIEIATASRSWRSPRTRPTEVVDALRQTRIKGKKVQVRRDRSGSPR